MCPSLGRLTLAAAPRHAPWAASPCHSDSLSPVVDVFSKSETDSFRTIGVHECTDCINKVQGPVERPVHCKFTGPAIYKYQLGTQRSARASTKQSTPGRDMTPNLNPFGIQNHHGTESDSPRLCFFRILVGVEVQLSRIPANSETAPTPAGMYRGATPMKPKGSMWSCPGRAACRSDVDWGSQ